MKPKCINIITIRGTHAQTNKFLGIAGNIFCNGLLLNDAMGNAEKHHDTITVFSYMLMPKMELQQITCSMPNTKGLVVRVVSDQPWTDYYEIAEFKDGAWSFQSEENTKQKLSAINQKGLDEIKKLIRIHGTFCISGRSIEYYDKKIDGCISDYYQRIELTKTGKLRVITREQVHLSEEKLNTCHIVEILFIIRRKIENQNRNK